MWSGVRSPHSVHVLHGLMCRRVKFFRKEYILFLKNTLRHTLRAVLPDFTVHTESRFAAPTFLDFSLLHIPHRCLGTNIRKTRGPGRRPPLPLKTNTIFTHKYGLFNDTEGRFRWRLCFVGGQHDPFSNEIGGSAPLKGEFQRTPNNSLLTLIRPQ